MTAKTFSGRRNPILTAAIAGAALLLGFHDLPVHAGWLSYRGPTQNGISPEKGWRTQFPEGGPKVLWKAEIGKGTSAVTVSGGRAYSMGNVGDKQDVVYCFDVRTGKELWKHEYPLALDPNMFEGGPRSTPTLDGQHVYTVSHQGDLWCLDAATGKKVWYRHFQKDFGGRRPSWGFAGSPLVAGNLLICDVGGEGGSTVALDKNSGEVVWKSGSDKAGYATPVLAKIGGQETVLVLKADALVGCAVKDGKELWRTPWKTDYDVNAATPLVDGDKVFISSGYNAGCALYQVSGGSITQLWRNKNLRAHVNTPVIWQGHVYGVDGNTNGGNFVCLDLATGNRKWEEKGVKGGSVIASDGKLIILSEKGELVIADASPNGFHPISRARVLDKRCWVQPTLDAGRLFVKDNDGDLECLDLGAK